MASTAGTQFNRSARTLTDFVTLAQSSEAEARTYLQGVKSRLEAVGDTQGPAAIAALLQTTGTLAENLSTPEKQAALGVVFPQTAGNWGQLQTLRTSTIGWTATGGQPRLEYLTGRVSQEGTQFKLTTPGGRTYNLKASSIQAPHVSAPAIPAGYMLGLIADGALRLSGTLDSDGQSFNVEGFAPADAAAFRTRESYDTFTIGRVDVPSDDSGKVNLVTGRGTVEVINEDLRKRLKAMPRLGIVLSGEPRTEADGRLVYDRNPSEFVGLARFTQTSVNEAGTTNAHAPADMAYSIFRMKPLYVPNDQEARVNHGSRMWAIGDVQLAADGATAESFRSTYISTATDSSPYMQAGTHADPIQTAVMLTEVP